MARHFVAASQQHLYRNGVPVAGAPITIAVWVKTSAPATLSAFATTLCKNVTNSWFLIGLNTGKVWVYEYDGSVPGQVVGSAVVPADTWVHLCGVFASDAARSAFVNGAIVATDTAALSPPTLDFVTVGMLVFGGALHPNFWDGDIAEFSIWNAALADAEVAQLATGVAATAVRAGNLVAYYPLLGTTSPEPDVKGGAGLILVNGPTQSAHPPIGGVVSGAAGRMFQVF